MTGRRFDHDDVAFLAGRKLGRPITEFVRPAEAAWTPILVVAGGQVAHCLGQRGLPQDTGTPRTVGLLRRWTLRGSATWDGAVLGDDEVWDPVRVTAVRPWVRHNGELGRVAAAAWDGRSESLQLHLEDGRQADSTRVSGLWLTRAEAGEDAGGG